MTQRMTGSVVEIRGTETTASMLMMRWSRKEQFMAAKSQVTSGFHSRTALILQQRNTLFVKTGVRTIGSHMLTWLFQEGGSYYQSVTKQ